tara:strand:+ start:1802 stop:2041 length:240 start_codon:yes stop_codon:yes gene_type:complete
MPFFKLKRLPFEKYKSYALKIEKEKNHFRASSTDYSPFLFIRDPGRITSGDPAKLRFENSKGEKSFTRKLDRFFSFSIY